MKTNTMKIAWAFAHVIDRNGEGQPCARLFLPVVFNAFARYPAGMACLRNPTPEERGWLTWLGRESNELLKLQEGWLPAAVAGYWHEVYVKPEGNKDIPGRCPQVAMAVDRMVDDIYGEE